MRSGFSAAIFLASLSFSRSAAQPSAITLTWKRASTFTSDACVAWPGVPSETLSLHRHQA